MENKTVAGIGDIVAEISRRREMRDQAFYQDLCQLRRIHGNHAVDEAFATLQA